MALNISISVTNVPQAATDLGVVLVAAKRKGYQETVLDGSNNPIPNPEGAGAFYLRMKREEIRQDYRDAIYQIKVEAAVIVARAEANTIDV